MKYALFALALAGAVPLAAACSLSKRALAALVSLVFLVVLAFNGTSINFFSYAFYRGTARGLEISLAYILSASVLLAVALAGLLRPVRRTSLFRSPGTWLYLALFAWFAVSAAANDNAQQIMGMAWDGVLTPRFVMSGRLLSVFELWKMAMLFLVYAATYAYVARARDAKAVFRAMAFVVLAAFLMVVREHLAGIYKVRGPFPHQNGLAMFMTFLGAVFFAGYLNLPRSRFRWLCGAAFVAASGMVFRTYSRGAILCYPVGVGVSALASLVPRFSAAKALRLAPLVLVGALGVSHMAPRLVERFVNAPESSGAKRAFFARTALNVAADRPLVGVGPNNWSIFLNTNEAFHDAHAVGDDEKGDVGIVETVYLLTAAECGWPGLAILLAWFAYYWFSALRLSFRLAGTAWAYVPAGLLGALTGCYLQSCLEWVLRQQQNLIVLMACFAVLSWLNQNARDLRAEA